MCFKSVVLFVTSLSFIEAQNPTRIYSGAFPDLYRSIQLLSADARNCTFDTWTSQNASVIPRGKILQQPQLVCDESTLSCALSGVPPCDVFCADSAEMIRLNISAVKLPGVMSQLDPATPINAAELRICRHVKTFMYCQVSVTRSDNPLKLTVRVRFAGEERADDDCGDFRRMLGTELEVCGKRGELAGKNGGLRGVEGWIWMICGVVGMVIIQ